MRQHALIFGALVLLVAWNASGAASGEDLIRLTRVASGLNRPLYATSPIHDQQRLFIVEQHSGQIKILDQTTGQVLPQPFLTIDGISRTGEQGLLGLAFDTYYNTSGKFYVNYTDVQGTTNVVEYQVSADPNVADPNSARTVLKINQPQISHNGGWIGFSPQDTYLYVAMGDGGGANDTGDGHTTDIGNAQDLTNNLLGKMLRIDVRRDDFPSDPTRNYGIPTNNPLVGREGDDEIWAYGLRNPWRNSFDRGTGDLYIGDVGQNSFEEINYQAASSLGGENYGWRTREGFEANPAYGGSKPAGVTDPVYAYGRERTPLGGISVTGGYVYHGPSIPELQGRYVFGDFGYGNVWSFEMDNGSVNDVQVHTQSIVPDVGNLFAIASFAEDARGDLYVVSIGGQIFRFDDMVAVSPVIETGDVWKYLDTGVDQGTAWRDLEFNDASWKQGASQLGYGDGDEATTVGFGSSTTNRNPTTYFRHEFEIADPSAIDEMLLGLLKDDGAAVYLNGTQILRTTNLAPGATYNTLADYFDAAAIEGNAENAYQQVRLSGDLLRAGRNVIAVEVHQHSVSSDDLSFDLRLGLIYNPSGTPGDLNGNGSLDVGDINELAAAIRSGSTASQYDLNHDGKVNIDDHRSWVHDLRGTWLGDTNLDGEFNESDFLGPLQSGQYEDNIVGNGRWEYGDWNGDGEFNSSDLVTVLTEGGYRVGPRQAVAAVPEPTSYVLFALGSIAICRRRGARS
ncbi:MAG: PQQ-dependent sugar dehydrogenase [Planctomycetales bacterium]|nr:PQQ-dependent sugar dehydrogenase [Planctomycetales bacterium]